MEDMSSEEQNWEFRDDHEQSLPSSSDNEVTWTASEFIAHQKGPAWYFLLFLATVLLAGIVYIVVRDVLTVVAIVTVAAGFGFFASRQPRTLHYTINSTGVTIGDKLYPHTALRSFSVQDEGGLRSIQLVPLKRFMPLISLYYPPEQEDHVLNTLSLYIPHEERRPDAIDKLMRHVRF